MDKNLRASIFERDRFRCRGCAKQAQEVHHIIFRSHGGGDEPDNLIALCRNCHEIAHGRRQGTMPAWVLQGMLQHNKWRVCCSIWKEFAFNRFCSTCDNRSADFACLLKGENVSRTDTCVDWTLRDLKVHR